jgi:hypothetical protein
MTGWRLFFVTLVCLVVLAAVYIGMNGYSAVQG